jgi:hypothetical protein
MKSTKTHVPRAHNMQCKLDKPAWDYGVAVPLRLTRMRTTKSPHGFSPELLVSVTVSSRTTPCPAVRTWPAAMRGLVTTRGPRKEALGPTAAPAPPPAPEERYTPRVQNRE